MNLQTEGIIDNMDGQKLDSPTASLILQMAREFDLDYMEEAPLTLAVDDESDQFCDEGLLAAVQNNAACMIQSVYRGLRERLRLQAQQAQRMTAEYDPDEEEAEAEAATTIQAGFRSYRLRRELDELIAMGMSSTDIVAVLPYVLLWL